MTPAEATAERLQGRVTREPWTAFAAWAADALGLRLSFDGDAYKLEPDQHVAADEATETQTSSRPGRTWLRRARVKAEGEIGAESVTAANPADVVRRLMERLKGLPETPGVCPRDQPTAVHEITQPLFAAYELEGGTVHVAGCRLEDRPVVRFTQMTEDDENAVEVRHCYVDPQGVLADADWIAKVGANRIGPLPTNASRGEHRLSEERLAAAKSASLAAGCEADATAAVVWIKHVSGVLRFEFGDESLDVPFEGWAKTLEPPAILCPLTGVSTYRLTTVEGGAICAAEQVGVCCVSGRRRALPELIRCAVTDQLSEAEWIAECSLTGEPALESELLVCSRCGERVLQRVMSAAGCQGCRSPQRVAIEDERLRAVFAKHPSLVARRWTLAQTPSVLVLESTGWFRRRVVTLDRETLAITHAAEASRFSTTWRSVPPASV